MNVGLDYRLLSGILLLAGVAALVPLLVPLLISPRWRGPKSEDTYECGVDTIGTAWTRFAISFYLFALIFVAFEVDVLYLFPVALIYNEPGLGWRDLVETAMFLVILSLAILFAWRKGVFQWK